MLSNHPSIIHTPKLATLLLMLLASVTFSASSNTTDQMQDFLPKASAVPGGIAVVDLGIEFDKTKDDTPAVYYNKQRAMVVNSSGHWKAILGIPLTASSGSHHLIVKTRDRAHNKKIGFQVTSKQYAEQHLQVKDKRKVNPTAEDLKRIGQEKIRINSALKHWADIPGANTRFVLPVTGELSSPFGLRRFFNQQPRKPHSGIDIAAPEGAPIQAPAAGKIIESGDFFFNGNSVFIDHGQGLITMYCHMRETYVKPGQIIKQGDPIGAVGQTGRATGPHLHWSVSLNNARVDPSLFFDDLNQLLGINAKNTDVK